MGSTSQSGTTPSRPRSLKKVHGPADSTFIADSTIGLAVSGTALAVEAGAVRAFVELTMKLPERKFKPMFLRLTEWAGARVGPAEGGVGDGGGGSEYGAAAVSPARQAAMFAVAVALSARLRAVFVPYYSYLWDSILFALTGADRGVGGAKGGGMKSAKRRKAEHPVAGSDHLTTGAGGSAVDGAGGGAGADGSGVDHVWRLRFRALRALLGCLLSDSVGFVTAERAGVVAPGVVLQLGEELPEHLRGELAGEGVGGVLMVAGSGVNAALSTSPTLSSIYTHSTARSVLSPTVTHSIITSYHHPHPRRRRHLGLYPRVRPRMHGPHPRRIRGRRRRGCYATGGFDARRRDPQAPCPQVPHGHEECSEEAAGAGDRVRGEDRRPVRMGGVGGVWGWVGEWVGVGVGVWVWV